MLEYIPYHTNIYLYMKLKLIVIICFYLVNYNNY